MRQGVLSGAAQVSNSEQTQKRRANIFVDLFPRSPKFKVRPMTCLIAIADEVLGETESSSERVLVLTEKPEIFVWYLNPPGLPLSVVAGAMEQIRPKLPIVIFSDHQTSHEEFQTVDAIATVSSEAPSFLPILQPFLSPGPNPVPFPRTDGEVKSRKGFEHDQPRVLDDLKAIVDSLSPAVRRQLIAEFRAVLAELTYAA